ncbi:MAG: hypothetical protein HY898_30115 [Deltaproteobacteria bacterium]|nr:hypothetical protein [Deltaproteobacteria bacterium]
MKIFAQLALATCLIVSATTAFAQANPAQPAPPTSAAASAPPALASPPTPTAPSASQAPAAVPLPPTPQPVAAAPKAAQPDHAKRLREAMVYCDSAYVHTECFLVRDNRTVLVTSLWPDMGRPFDVSTLMPPHVAAQSTSVEVLTDDDELGVYSYVVHLDRDLPGVPLVFARNRPVLGEEVVSGRYEGSSKPVEVIHAQVVALSDAHLAVYGVPWDMPLLNRSGELVGMNRRGFAGPPDQVLAKAQPRGASVWPLIGFRFGGASGGPFGGGGALLSLDLGITLWDKLSLVGNVGAIFSGKENVSLPAPKGLGPGTTEIYKNTLTFGLEARGRIRLPVSGADLYFDPVIGFQMFKAGPTGGNAFFSGDAGCNPAVQACAVTVRDAQPYLGQYSRWGYGPSIGADLRFSIASLGFRFTPKSLSHDLPNTYMGMFGISFP